MFLRILSLLIAFLLPWGIYYIYVKIMTTQGKSCKTMRAYLPVLMVLSLICTALLFIFIRFLHTDSVEKGKFIPAHTQNGKIIPPHFE